MNVFHVIKITQMVPNQAKRLIKYIGTEFSCLLDIYPE